MKSCKKNRRMVQEYRAAHPGISEKKAREALGLPPKPKKKKYIEGRDYHMVGSTMVYH